MAARSIYYSALAANASVSSALPAVPCTVSETRSQPLLDRCSDWQMSVVRMTLPSRSLPTYRLMPQLGQADPNLLEYSVGVSLSMTGSFAPIWPQVVLPNTCVFNLVLVALGAVVRSLSVDVVSGASATFASAADVATALETEIQAAGGLWSTVTVTADPFARLVLTPPSNYVLAVSSVTGADDGIAAAFAGIPVSQFGTRTNDKFTALNACGLQPGLTQTITSTQSHAVYWVPEDGTAPKAAAPLVAPDYSTQYYWGHSVSHAVGLWNTAFAAAFEACVTDLGNQWRILFPNAFPGVQSTAPFITFDPGSQLFSMNASPFSSPSLGGAAASTGQLYPAPAEAMVVSTDEASDLLFGNWNETTPAASLGTAQYATLDFSLAPVDGFVKLTQDSSSLLGAWTPVTSLLVTSQQIPVRGEQISAPFISGNAANAVGVASSFAPIVAEISLLGQSCFVPSTEISVYEPTTIRFVGLQGSGALTTLDFSLFWRDNFGVIRQVFLPPGSSTFTLKAQFQYVGA